MSSPAWKRQEWTLARLAALLAGLARRNKGFTVEEIRKRWGIGIRDLMLLTHRLGGQEDMGTQAWHHLDLRIDYDDAGNLEVGSIGADALELLTRLPREEAHVAAEALEGLALSSKKRALAVGIAARLRKAAGKAPDARSLIYRPGETTAQRDRVELVSEAMDEGSALEFDYHGAGATKKSRSARPLTLRRDGRVWRALAWDTDRKALRVFRLEHMRQIVQGAFVELPENLDIASLVNRDLGGFSPRGNEVKVKMKVSNRVFQEFKPAFQSGAKKTGKGNVNVTLLADHAQWLVRTFLRYAGEVTVLGPPDFKKAWTDEIAAIKKKHQQS